MIGVGLGIGRRKKRGSGGGGGGSSLTYGFLASRDEGTTGDWYVDASVSSSGAGTSPATAFKTIAEAISALSADNQTIRVRNNGGSGKYRESVTAPRPVKIKGYATEKPIITAANTITGFVQCTGADAAVLGSLSPSAIWKKSGIAKSVFAGSEVRAAHPYQDGVRLTPAIAWLPNPQYPDNQDATQQYLTSVSTLTYTFDPGGPNEEIRIEGYEFPSELHSYTQAQVETADILFHCKENINART